MVMDNEEELMEDYEKAKRIEQIANAEKQREKMAALGQLAGGIAHDFNNQLMSIIGNATMIQKTDDIDKIKDYAERIIHISQGTANLIKKILLFSKQKSDINKPMDLKSVLDNTYNMVELIINKKIELKYSYNAINKMVLGDEAQIENLIINLIINSRDAMEDMSGEEYINIVTEDTVIFSNIDLSHGEVIIPGEYIKIYVEDNGIGMNEETLNKIFEPYFTTKNKHDGTGLGLPVVFGTVKSHSGYINVESRIKIGTKIEIYLPILKKIENNICKIENEASSNLIMLVDDDIDALDVETELLEDLGYDVVKYSNPVESLRYYMNDYEKIGFVVLDMIMPDMSGKMLYEELQKLNKDVTAIFISGYTGHADYEELIKKGFVVIQKPFTFAELSFEIAKIYV